MQFDRRDATKLFSAAVLAGVPGFGSQVFASGEVSGGTLNMLVWPAPNQLTSAITTAGSEAIISPKIFDGLLDYDFEMNPRPQLATSWDVSEDGKRITFNLREGVRWHDGEDFTSEDVKFSVLNMWKEFHSRGRSTYANVIDVETPDELTAVLVLSRPTSSIMKALASMESQVVPEHLYAGTDILTNPHNTAPVGTGPFKFASFARGDNVVLERNEDYWAEEKPNLDRIIFRFIPDAATRSASLESGQSHLVNMSQLPLADIARFEESPDFEVETLGYEFINTTHYMEFNLDHPILGDVNVRRAIGHAINRDWITDNIWFGYGETATGPIHHALTSYHTTDGVPVVDFDPAKAESLLDEAGYPRGSDGTRFSLTLDPLPYGDQFFRSGEYIKQLLSDVGIAVEIRSQDFASYVQRIYTDRDFDFTNASANGGSDPAIGVQRFYWSQNFQPGVAFSNASGYNNPDVDEALEAASATTDEAERSAYYAEFQRLVMEDLPTLPVTSVFRVTVSDRNLKNHTLGAVGTHSNFAEVYFES